MLRKLGLVDPLRRTLLQVDVAVLRGFDADRGGQRGDESRQRRSGSPARLDTLRAWQLRSAWRRPSGDALGGRGRPAGAAGNSSRAFTPSGSRSRSRPMRTGQQFAAGAQRRRAKPGERSCLGAARGAAGNAGTPCARGAGHAWPGHARACRGAARSLPRDTLFVSTGTASTGRGGATEQRQRHWCPAAIGRCGSRRNA